MNCNCYYWTLKFHQCKALAGQSVQGPADKRTSDPNPQPASIQPQERFITYSDGSVDLAHLAMQRQRS